MSESHHQWVPGEIAPARLGLVASITATAIAIGMLYPVSISVAQQRGDAPSPAAGLSVEQKAPGQRREVAGAGARTGATGVAPPLDPAGDGAPSGMLDLNDPESRAARDAPAAVRFRGKPLFEVRTPIGELSIAQRAAAIEARLRELADGPPQGLNALQLFERDGMTHFCHGSPVDLEEFEYIFSVEQAATCIPIWEALGQITFIGHSHLCKAFAIGRERVYEVVTKEFEIHPEFRYIVSVGSVGQPRDHDPRASYTIYDSNRGKFEFKRVEYDVSAAARKIFNDTRLSDRFGARLFAGV